MNGRSEQIETVEGRLRLWKEQHVCWVTKRVVREGLLRCSCGYIQAVGGWQAAYRIQAEHLKATMPQPDLRGGQVGHWLLLWGLTRSGKHQNWMCRCILCGFEVHSVDLTGRLLPLTGSLYRKRREHDKQEHPDKLVEQKDAENAALGKT